jgi:hypothetical protein
MLNIALNIFKHHQVPLVHWCVLQDSQSLQFQAVIEFLDWAAQTELLGEMGWKGGRCKLTSHGLCHEFGRNQWNEVASKYTT